MDVQGRWHLEATDSQEEDGQDLVDVMAGRLLGPVIDGGSLQQGRVRRELQVDYGEYTEFLEEVKGGGSRLGEEENWLKHQIFDLCNLGE